MFHSSRTSDPSRADAPPRRGRATIALLAMVPLAATALLSATPAAANIAGGTSPDAHTKNDVYVSSTGHVELLSVRPGGTWSPVNLTTNAGAPLAPTTATPSYFAWPAQHSQSVVYIDSSGNVIEIYRLPGASRWSWANLTTRAPGAHLAKPSSPVVGYAWTAGNSKQVIYLDAANHVNRLVTTLTADWTWTDMTAYLGAPPAAPGSGLTAYDWPAQNSDQIAYVTRADHVQEMFVKQGFAWSTADLTAYAATSGPVTPADPSSPLAGYAAGSTKQVAYRGTNGHVEQLFDVAGSPWQAQDLTVSAGAPALRTGSAIVGYAAPDAVFVVYVDQRGYLEELSSPTSGSRWAVGNLSTQPIGGSALPSNIASLTGYYWSDENCRQVAYIDTRHHISELSIPLDGPQWSWTDLTSAFGGPQAA